MHFFRYFLFAVLLMGAAGMALAQDESELKAGDTRTDAKGIEQVYVPAGCFMMGTSDEQMEAVMAEQPPTWVQRILPAEQPQHEVCITKGYWIDKTEVTNAAFQAFVDDGGYTTEEYWSEN